MGDLGDLLVGIGTVLAALVSAASFVWLAVRTSRRERGGSASTAASLLSDALADGRIDPDEAAAIAEALREQEEQ
ncbi:MAG: hypothetical protein ACRDMV_10900 [Streptosporangiales bacterium]